MSDMSPVLPGVNESVCEELREALADTFAFYFRAHSFHWNVTGPLFSQLHSFFRSVYEDAWSAVDDLAERIRSLDAMAPASLADMLAPATVGSTGTDVPDSETMVQQLLSDNQTVLSSLRDAQAKASIYNMQGLANFLQERIDKHDRWTWQLQATLRPAPVRRDVLYDHARIMARASSAPVEME